MSTLKHLDTHRRPGEESLDLYPGLVVSDGDHSRQSGSITVGRTRLPLWAFIGNVIHAGWIRGVADYYHHEDWNVFGTGRAQRVLPLAPQPSRRIRSADPAAR